EPTQAGEHRMRADVASATDRDAADVAVDADLTRLATCSRRTGDQDRVTIDPRAIADPHEGGAIDDDTNGQPNATSDASPAETVVTNPELGSQTAGHPEDESAHGIDQRATRSRERAASVAHAGSRRAAAAMMRGQS